MKKLLIPLFFLTFFLIQSCSNTEKVIDTTKDTWRILASVNAQSPSLMLIQFPDDTILSNDVYSANNSGQSLPGPVVKIAEFRGLLYLFIPSQYVIKVINKSTFKLVGTIDYTADKLVPTDICFANATDAYVAHGADTVVSLVDLTNYAVARKIKVGKHPVAIACSGNQIYVANQADNTVSVIDSRTHNQVALIPVQTAPTYVAMNSEGLQAIVISLGAGKLDSTISKTAAQGTLIDITTRAVINTLDLNAGSTNAVDIIPYGIAVSKYDWAYIPSQICLLSYDARSGNRVNFIQSVAYNSIYYNYIRDELLVLQNNSNVYSAMTLDMDSYNPKATHTFALSVNFVFPL
ncbi:MAG: hypothetical protein ABSG15_06815 [FCB group bacterium]